MWERMKDQPLGKNDSPQWEALLSKRTLHSTQSTHWFIKIKQLEPETDLLLATGSAISNLARNWKYCSSVWSVKPVPTSSICVAHVKTGSRRRSLTRGHTWQPRDPSSPWGPRLGSLHSGPASEKTWDAWSSPDTRRATRDTGNRGSASRGWCRGSAATSPSRSGSWWLGVDESTWSF